MLDHAKRSSPFGDQLAQPYTDEKWRDLTDKANTAFSNADYRVADGYYLAAISEAEDRFRASVTALDRSANDTVPMVIVSALNKARNHAALKDHDALELTLQTTASLLVDVIQDKSLPVASRVACVEHLPQLISGYSDTVEDLRIDGERFNRTMSICRDAALSFLKTHAAQA
ncbi:MAG: hypothetical protein AAGH42_01980 [Pseudomonadota bacterium]